MWHVACPGNSILLHYALGSHAIKIKGLCEYRVISTSGYLRSLIACNTVLVVLDPAIRHCSTGYCTST